MSGGRDRADWVRNLRADPAVGIRIGSDGPERRATARPLDAGTDEDSRARRLILGKYQSPGSHDLESFDRHALVVAIDVVQDEGDTATTITT